MKTNRRDFLKAGMSTSGGLVISLVTPACKTIDPTVIPSVKNPGVFQTIYLEVTTDNLFYLTFDRSEMGQGIITGQATIFGEEADINPSRFIMRPADADTRFGVQITGGSNSTKKGWPVWRKAAATYRHALIRLAAKTWEVPVSEITTLDGVLYHHKTNQKMPYSKLNQLVAGSTLVQEPKFKKPVEYRYIGKFDQSVDARDKATGSTDFGIDLELPEMRTAVVIRPAVFGAKLRSADLLAIKALPDVEEAFVIDSGVAIICRKYWQCLAVRPKLTDQMIKWEEQELKISSQDLYSDYKDELDQNPPSVRSGQKIVSAEYVLPYLAHAPLEPQNCTAWFKSSDCLEIWAPTQAPTFVRRYAAAVSGLDRSQIIVHVSKYLGGGFGRRGSLDFTAEAIQIALKVRYPVKVLWSREDDMQHSPLRPMSVHRFDAVVDGKIVSWRHQIVGQSIVQELITEYAGFIGPAWLPSWMGRFLGRGATNLMEWLNFAPLLKEGGVQAYDIDVDFKVIDKKLPIPVSFWRSVGNSHNGFTVEGFLDEICHALHRDPVDFRIELLSKNKRAQNVVKAVAKASSWQETKPAKN
ncbi:MAG: hypothetical protein CMP10_18000, partial [Zetaproteobacteria bacterium]|nr:hypothetical protein [Pseudobdellovibrionaceae bacterium]